MRKTLETTSKAVISPDLHRAVIFDMDGVITRTAKVHAAAWQEMFDIWLKQYASKSGKAFQPFDIHRDYLRYLDGKPRYEGVQSFLESRGLQLPWGYPDDPPGENTICGLGNRKNELYLAKLSEQPPEVYPATLQLIQELKAHQIKTGVISASKNARQVLETIGILNLFDTRVDGILAEERGLRGKPQPDVFWEAARELGTDPANAVIVEDAISGVQAGSRGGFSLVIGVDRDHNTHSLIANGANVVVRDLSEVIIESASREEPPDALAQFEAIRARLESGNPVVFLDYDGTLTPIVPDPDTANLSPTMAEALQELSRKFPVAVISGRGLSDVRRRIDLPNVFYAGSHGFEIEGPNHFHYENPEGQSFLGVLDEAERLLKEALADVDGIQVERKKYAIAVHYRRLKAVEKLGFIEESVDRIRQQTGRLRKSYGKKIFELHPDMDWNKGKALTFLLNTMFPKGKDRQNILPIYIGDDTTDEDAFKILKTRGFGIRVLGETQQKTLADYTLQNTSAVGEFIQQLTAWRKNP